jgi:hypothetical protein
MPPRIASVIVVIAVVLAGIAGVWAAGVGREDERQMSWDFAFVVPGSPQQVVVVFYPETGANEDEPVVLPRRAAVKFGASKLTVTLFTDVPRSGHQFPPFGTSCVRAKLPDGSPVTSIVDGYDRSTSTGDEPILEFLKRDPGKCPPIKTSD